MFINSKIVYYIYITNILLILFLFHMQLLFLLFLGFVLGLLLAWKGIDIINNWKSFRNLIEKSSKEQNFFKAALTVCLNYLFKSKEKSNNPKIRVDFATL